MPAGGCCNLLSINLTQFINDNNNDFDYKKLKKYVKIATRFADNINDISNVPLKQYKEALNKRRRIGLGILGWGSALYLLKTKFASSKATKIKNELMKTITHTAIETSINLAKEKGMFDGCDPEKHAENVFWDYIDLPENLRNKLKKYGIRNSALFSIQPTGNTSILANIVSGGLEPVFMPEYIRTVIVNEAPEHIKEICPKYWEGEFAPNDYFELVKEGTDDVLRCEDDEGVIYKIDKNRGLTKEVLCEDYAVRHLKETEDWDAKAEWARTALDLSVAAHLKDMTEFGRWIDSSMSKTVNCPADYPYEDFKRLYLDAYKSKYLKGITTYRSGTMTSVLSEVKQHSRNDAKKRPKQLECDVYHISRNKQPYIILVGLLDGMPYEVFALKNNNDTVDNKVTKGVIKKLRRAKYRAEFEDDTELSPVSAFTESEEDIITRLVSTALRHNTPIEFIQHQLEKTKGDLNSLAKCISRALKNYVKDGAEIKGEECPECGGKLIRESGCKSCIDENGVGCFYSACG